MSMSKPRLLATTLLALGGIGLLAQTSPRALAQAAVSPVLVTNDNTAPVPTTVANTVATTVTNTVATSTNITGGTVTAINDADSNFAQFAGTCNPSGGEVWLGTLSSPVPFGKRFVIEQFSIELSLPVTAMAKAYIRPLKPGQPVDNFPRQPIPLLNQGAGYTYATQRKVYNANQPLHAMMDYGWNLDVVIQSTDPIAASAGSCWYTVTGHYIAGSVPIVLGQ